MCAPMLFAGVLFLQALLHLFEVVVPKHLHQQRSNLSLQRRMRRSSCKLRRTSSSN